MQQSIPQRLSQEHISNSFDGDKEESNNRKEKREAMSNRRARVEIDQMYKQRVYEISKLNHRRTRSQAISSTGFHAVCGIRYVWIKSKPGRVRIGIEECVKIKIV